MSKYPVFMKHVVRRGRVRLVPALPRRVRIRLWVTGRIDHVAIRLIEHERYRLAAALWPSIRGLM
jgi:hypothetical protein